MDTLWINELEFYQNIGETICRPTDQSIQKVTVYVTKLLSPYYELIGEIAGSNSPDELDSVIDSADTPTDFKTLEKRYLEKINENEKLQKQLSQLKKSTNNNIAPLSVNTDVKSADLIHLINQIIKDLNKKAEVPITEDNCENLEDLKISYQATLLKLDEKLEALDSSNDDFDQTEALIEQLRFEKVEYLKKYKRSMILLFNTYKEFAGAFGLDAPEDPDIEIEAFEKFIEDS